MVILTPESACEFITATEIQNDYYIFSNSTGYTVLRDVISSACILQKNEIIYMPLNFRYMDEYQTDFIEPETHFKSLIFMNYSMSQFSTKEILTAIRTKQYKTDSVTREYSFSKDWVDNWKTNKRLTVKPSGKNLIFSANRDVFTSMAQSCDGLSAYGDYEKYNQSPPHMHHDWGENTSKSVGITFYYWTPPQKRKAMSEKVFFHQLRRGIGSAIVTLKNNPNNEKYRDIVLRCCLKDIGYDTQSEGTKGYYLYTAICELDCRNEFLGPIAEVFLKRLPYCLFQQLNDILLSYAEDGWKKATEILSAKYAQLKEKLSKQRSFPSRYCEREQFEYMMVSRMNAANWNVFKELVEDAGEIILARKDDSCSYYDWFMGTSEEQFGKDVVWDYLKQESFVSDNVKAFADGYLQTEQTQAEHQAKRKEERVSIAELIKTIYPLFVANHVYKNISYYLKFARKATSEELIELAEYIENNPDENEKAKLLQVFRRVDYPINIEPLLAYASSENEHLKKAAVSALERLKDPRIHNIAVSFLESGDVESGLSLLKGTWKKNDDILIRKAVLKSKRVTHAMQMALRDIYGRHTSLSCEDILMHAYRNGECAFCRWGIVEAMGKNKVLSDEVLQECRYDSYHETRTYASSVRNERGVEA